MQIRATALVVAVVRRRRAFQDFAALADCSFDLLGSSAAVNPYGATRGAVIQLTLRVLLGLYLD